MGARCLGGVFGVQQREVGTDAGIVGVLLEVVMHARAGVGKQDVMDELDGRRRALDVQQDRANAGQRNGM